MRHAPEQITMKLYGLRHERNGSVRADVFAKKLSQFVKGLQLADREVNGQKTLEYLIYDLQKSSAVAKCEEYQYSSQRVPEGSSIKYFQSAVNALAQGKAVPQSTPTKLLAAIRDLSNGCDRFFSHGEITTGKDGENVVRIDQFLNSQVKKAIEKLEDTGKGSVLFSGVAFGNFDGVLKEVDLRGVVARAKLVLTIGGIELDCICNEVTVDNLRECLDKRALVSAAAIYSGESKLPARLDIKKIQLLGASRGVSRWSGAFNVPAQKEDDVW